MKPGLANDAELYQAMAGAEAGAGAEVPEKEWNTKRLLEYVNGEVDLGEIKQKVTP